MLNDSNAQLDIQNLPVISGIRLQLHQLFTNLISNSAKYHRNGVAPHIQVFAELIDNAGIFSRPGKAYKIPFLDNGIGFEESYSKHIFELFRRLHCKTAYPGTGVGLTICKRVVENHNGVITAEGWTGKGAAFYIYLPVEIQ